MTSRFPSQVARATAVRSCASFVALVFACEAGAGDWTFSPHLSLSEQYTDNVTLSDRDTLTDYITQINAGLSLSGTSRRLNSDIRYNRQEQIYAKNDNFSGDNHQLQGTTDLLLVEHWLNFRAQSSVSQQTIDNSRRFGRSNRLQTGNQTTVIFREYNPVLSHRFGKWGVLNGSYSLSETDTSGGNVGTNGGAGDDEIYSIGFSTGSILPRTPMTVSYSKSEENFDSGRTNSQESYSGSISYIFNRKLRANFGAGWSNNTGRNANDSGFTWSAGGTWTPSSRTEFTMGYSRQNFGNSINFNARHRHRRWNFAASYNESIRTRSQDLRDLVLVPLTDGFGNPVFDPTDAAFIDNPGALSTITNESRVTKNLNVTTNYRSRRGTARLTFFNNQRDGQSSNGSETITGLSASYNRSLSRRSSVGISTNIRRTKSSGSSGNNEETFSVSPYGTYTVGPHTDLRVNYGYSAGSGNGSGDKFAENSLSATFTFHF